MSLKRRAILIVATASLGAMLASTSASAYNSVSYWNVSSTPLKVSGQGSSAQAYGYIKIFNGSSGTRMYSYAANKFTDADNHRAYITGETQYNAGTCRSEGTTVVVKGIEVSSSTSCARQFYDKDGYRIDGLNYTTSSWTQMPYKNWNVDGGADRGRLVVNLAIDVPWRSDPVSGPSYSAADTW